MVLWAFTRLMRTGSRRFFALSAVSLAILIASHNLLSFVLIAFTVGLDFVGSRAAARGPPAAPAGLRRWRGRPRRGCWRSA